MWQVEELHISRKDRWNDPKTSFEGRLLLKNADGRKVEFTLEEQDCVDLLNAGGTVVKTTAAFVGATMQQRQIVVNFPVIEDKTKDRDEN